VQQHCALGSDVSPMLPWIPKALRARPTDGTLEAQLIDEIARRALHRLSLRKRNVSLFHERELYDIMSIRGGISPEAPSTQSEACQGFLVKHGGLMFKKVLDTSTHFNVFISFVTAILIQFSGAKAILHSQGQRFDMGKTCRLE